MTEARAAAEQLRSLTSEQRLALFDAAMPADPAELWTSGLVGAAERIAVAWTRAHGRLVAIDDALAVEASRQLAFQGSPPDPLRLVADPADQRLRVTPPMVVGSTWGRASEPDDAFGSAIVRSLATALPWLHANVPVGDGILAKLPDVLAAARSRLTSADLVMPLAGYGVEWPGASDTLAALGARPFKAPRGVKVEGAALKVGPFVIALHPTAGYAWPFLRPALLDHGVPEAIVAMLQPVPRAVLEGSRFLLADDAAAIAERAASSPVARGPGRRTRRHRSLNSCSGSTTPLDLTHSARLFLQLLALPSPTKAAIQRWNGWTGTVLARAAKPLVDAGLGIAAQRRRAGRDVFLGGPWTTLPAPDLPVEAWKLEMYGASMLPDGSVAKPLDRLVPMRPIHELFTQAWARWEAGDRPAFERLPARR